MRSLERVQPGTGDARPLDAASVHAEHADFVWASLGRLGVRESDLEDSLQEVFVVVHRRLHTFDGTARMTTWLFGICMRVAAAYHRTAHRRRETVMETVPDEWMAPASGDPEQIAATREARTRLEQILDEMDLEKRAVFVMFEIDQLPCDEIATIVGVPVGTVYSRLHAARKAFERALATPPCTPAGGRRAGEPR